MKTFPYIEDYLEIIAGYRETSGVTPTSFVFVEYKPIVNLARYDVKILESMAWSTFTGTALTERQGELAVKLVLKYAKQLAQKDIDVGPAEFPNWRHTLRRMDYSRRLYVEEDQLYLRFPYENQLIEDIRKFSKDSQGSITWHKLQKVWQIALTEYNLSWMHTWATLQGFEIADDVTKLLNTIKQVEQTSYAVELYINDTKLAIRNAESSLIDYIETNLGGFELDNLLRLVDKSAVLGYTLSEDIVSAITETYGTHIYNLLSSKEIKINPESLTFRSDLDTVFEYATIVDCWPVVIYESTGNQQLKNAIESRVDYTTDRYLYSNKPNRSLQSIPLLVSSAGMMFGGDKQIMIQRAEKVVYCAAEVYNTKQVTKVKSIAS